MIDTIIEELFKERAEKLELLKQLVETKDKLIDQIELNTALSVKIAQLTGGLNARD